MMERVNLVGWLLTRDSWRRMLAAVAKREQEKAKAKARGGERK